MPRPHRLPAALAATVLIGLGLAGPAARAAETVKLTLKDHQFTPAAVTVPAGERFKIEITNHEPSAAEFESKGLKVEKIVAAGATVTVSAGPLKPGSYEFVDEYHEDVAKGTLTAVAK